MTVRIRNVNDECGTSGCVLVRNDSSLAYPDPWVAERAMEGSIQRTNSIIHVRNALAGPTKPRGTSGKMPSAPVLSSHVNRHVHSSSSDNQVSRDDGGMSYTYLLTRERVHLLAR